MISEDRPRDLARDQETPAERGRPNTLHLKNKGITLVAERVERRTDDEYELAFERGQGLVDGAHTYELIGQPYSQQMTW